MARKSDLVVEERARVARGNGNSVTGSWGAIIDDLQALWLDTAPLALENSAEFCTQSIGGNNLIAGHNCSIMHGSWQYLLLLGLTANPGRNLKFYRAHIARLAQERNLRRLLIAGCCDYTMLAIALSAFEDANITPDITVVDRCDTPLSLCRWFAKRYGCMIATEKTEILHYTAEAPFDLICTDGFLSVFTQDTRPDLIASWHALLKPGGYVVTTNNLGGAEKNDTLPPKTVAGLCQKAADIRKKQGLEFDLSDEDLRRLAHDFFSRPRPKYVESAEALQALFLPDQFRLDRLEISEIDGLAIGESDDSGKVQKILNARIVAERL